MVTITNQIFSLIILLVNTDENIRIIYTEEYNEQKRNKRKQIIRWHVNFANEVTDVISSTVKFIREYSDKKLSSIYTDNITNNIIVGLK